MHNPLLQISLEVPFDRIRPEHVEPAIDVLLEDAKNAIDAITARREALTFESTFGALERATERLEFAMGVTGHLESVATTPELRAAYNAVRPKTSEFWSTIPLNDALYAVLKAYAETDEAKRLDPTRARFVRKTLDEFRRHGAELDPTGKKRLSEIDVELSRLTMRFSQNVLDATNKYELVLEDETRLSGLPASAKTAARESARAKGLAGYRFTLQEPSLVAVLTYADDAALREHIWRAYNTRATEGDLDNRPILSRILELRGEKARLLGYPNFAALVLEDRMAKNPERACHFVDDLRERAMAAFERENQELLAFRREVEGKDAPELAPWDVGYWAEKRRRAHFDFDEEELRPYFASDRVVAGLFAVVERLYGVRIEKRELPTWDPSVESYGVLDADGTFLAAFYVDLYPRESKRGGAWMNSLLTGLPTAEGMKPHLGLFCANVTPPSESRPALLRHREVETLFHEFGHLMHHVLSRVTVRSLAGTHVAWDFVELPSQIMENWTWEREALDLFARHYETDEPIPDALYEKMQRARTYRSANATMRQLGFATVDLALHIDFDPARHGDPIDYAREVLGRFAPAKLPPEHAMIASFSHLFASPVGYAAGYYSYKWAEVLDADAFSRFKKEGIFNTETGRAFRTNILEKGDSREPEDLFREFMGRDPALDALLERAGLVERSEGSEAAQGR